MRYLLALICPPLVMVSYKRWFSAASSAILYALAIAWARYGIGALIEFFLILWAFNVIGNQKAAVETQEFVETVEPIPVIRS